MPLKVLLLNVSAEGITAKNKNLTITQANINSKPTLHDYHAIIIDVNDVLNPAFWGLLAESRIDASNIRLKDFKEQVEEQIGTGGVAFIFCGESVASEFGYKTDTNTNFGYINNYFPNPIDPGVVNEQGDTFYVRNEEVRYFSPLVSKMLDSGVSWDCFFSELPENARVIATNRAGYPIFAEVPIGNGKLVLLPRLKDRQAAINILVNEVLPHMVHEDETIAIPDWVITLNHPFEKEIRETMGKIGKAKRLLYTKDRLLKKAVSFALETIGFYVVELPEDSHADLEIIDGVQKAVVKAKGLEMRLSDRIDVLPLLGYSTPEGVTAKGIFVSNSEFAKPPEQREKTAYKQGAIELANDTKLSLLNTIELYDLVMATLQGKATAANVQQFREKILQGKGIVNF
jgi:hypothetical protein